MGKKLGAYPYYCAKCGKELILQAEMGFLPTSKTKYKDEQGNKIKTNYGGQPICPVCGTILISAAYKDRYPVKKDK